MLNSQYACKNIIDRQVTISLLKNVLIIVTKKTYCVRTKGSKSRYYIGREQKKHLVGIL